ncbi:MAG: CHAD domain-containing protein [Anaerolineales bacterium]|nr:CHAD domain-containing protein [Anaerolineales bacterium]
MMTPQTEEFTPTPGQLLLDAFEKRWKKYRLELKRCRTEFSNEAVHDLRVALRRLLSLVELLNSISPRPRLRKLNRAFKSQLDDLDDLRDTQVMLAEISETVQEFPQLQQVQHHLESAEKRALKGLRRELKKLDLKEITRRVQKTRETLKDEADAALVEPILQSVDDAFLAMKQKYERVDPPQPASIHRVRVALKNFRYMVEIIYPLLDGFPMENLNHMNDHQSMMGEIQDLEVLMQTLVDFSERASSSDSSAPLNITLEPVFQYYKVRHAEAIATYLNNKTMFENFWRSSPEQSFPWEKTL